MGIQDRDYYWENWRERERREAERQTRGEPKPKTRYPWWLICLAVTGAIYDLSLIVRFLRWVLTKIPA